MKRNERMIFMALGHAVVKGDDSLLNDAQKEFVMKNKEQFNRLVEQAKKEDRMNRWKDRFVHLPRQPLHLTVIILNGLADILHSMTSPFEDIDDKMSQNIDRKIAMRRNPANEELNDFSNQVIMPTLIELEDEEGLKRHHEWQERKGIRMKTKLKS